MAPAVAFHVEQRRAVASWPRPPADGGRTRGGQLIGYVAAALGGALGALARWGVGEALPHRSGSWPWATVLVNLTGCLALGVLLAAVFARNPQRAWLRPFLGTGVLGGYTTFSTFSVDAVQLADAGRWAPAAGYVGVSVVGGVLAAAAGVALGRVLLPVRGEPR